MSSGQLLPRFRPRSGRRSPAFCSPRRLLEGRSSAGAGLRRRAKRLVASRARPGRMRVSPSVACGRHRQDGGARPRRCPAARLGQSLMARAAVPPRVQPTPSLTPGPRLIVGDKRRLGEHPRCCCGSRPRSAGWSRCRRSRWKKPLRSSAALAALHHIGEQAGGDALLLSLLFFTPPKAVQSMVVSGFWAGSRCWTEAFYPDEMPASIFLDGQMLARMESSALHWPGARPS